jgi:citrate lyase subunit beta/citryl-CoA lyase
MTSDLRRSALFVPVGVERFYPRAAASGADLVVLDLEDSVPDDRKEQARAQLALARQAVQARRCAVRVNAQAVLIAGDIAACAACSADELVLPKVESVADIVAARKLIARHPGWYPALSILVESMAGVRKIPALLQHGGLIASVALGMEDLSAELLLAGPGDSAGGLHWLHGQLLVWAGGSATVPVGLFGAIGNFSDPASERPPRPGGRATGAPTAFTRRKCPSPTRPTPRAGRTWPGARKSCAPRGSPRNTVAARPPWPGA